MDDEEFDINGVENDECRENQVSTRSRSDRAFI